MTVYNCTPHAITIRPGLVPSARNTGEDIVIEPSGFVVRCTTKAEQVGEFDYSVPIFRTELVEVVGWPPDAQSGDIVIVSSLAAQNAGPKDFTVVSPDTGPTAVRENGQVVAVRAFQVF